jgi:cellulose synthase (UDP-forming)
MSLLTSRKFWSAKMRLRTRLCYLSGFCYYIHTAIFTLITPAIPLTLLIFMPDRVRLINYLLILPSLVYNLAVFPAWHHCRFGPSAFMAKALYGWAHLFCLFDLIRGKRIRWQATGDAGRKAGTRRVWVGVALWNVPTCAAWVLLSLWRMTRYGAANYALMLAAALFASLVTWMMVASRRNYVRTAVKEIAQ